MASSASSAAVTPSAKAAGGGGGGGGGGAAADDLSPEGLKIFSFTIAGRRYDCFLTHNWGMMLADGTYDNHERVARVCKALVARGIKPWFDQERMKGNIVKQMCDGIDASKIVLVFVTKDYISKVRGSNEADNCQREFNYAMQQKSALMLPVVMESSCLNSKKWGGPVGMALGGHLYFNLSNDDGFEAKMDDLADKIRALCIESDERDKRDAAEEAAEAASAPPAALPIPSAALDLPAPPGSTRAWLQTKVAADELPGLVSAFEDEGYDTLVKVLKAWDRGLLSESDGSLLDLCMRGGCSVGHMMAVLKSIEEEKRKEEEAAEDSSLANEAGDGLSEEKQAELSVQIFGANATAEMRRGALKELVGLATSMELEEARSWLVPVLERVLVEFPFEYETRKQVFLLIKEQQLVLGGEALRSLKLDIESPKNKVPRRALDIAFAMAKFASKDEYAEEVSPDLLILLVRGCFLHEHRRRMLFVLYNLAYKDQNEVVMRDEALGIEKALNTIMSDKNADPETVGRACGVFLNLKFELPDATTAFCLQAAFLQTVEIDGKHVDDIAELLALLGSLPCQVFECMAEKLRSSDVSVKRKLKLLDAVERVFAVEKDSVEKNSGRVLQLCNPDLGLVRAMLAAIPELDEDEEEDENWEKMSSKVWFILQGLAIVPSNIEGLLAADTHKVAFSHLQRTQGDVARIHEQPFLMTLMLLVNMSEWPNARERLTEAGVIDFAKDIYDDDSFIGMLATILLAFLVGSDEDENSVDKDLLEANETALERIQHCLVLTANKEGGDDWDFGVFSLAIITKAVKNIVINDKNMSRLAVREVSDALIKILKLAGNDLESLEASVDILTRFFSLFLGDPSQSERFRSLKEAGLEQALKGLQDHYGDFEEETRRNINYMLEICGKPDQQPRRPSGVAASTPAQGGSTERKHVMMSYSWSDKERVKGLCQKLREGGLDVWRDDDGSKVLCKMADGQGIDDMMGRAVDSSSHVIVCVSRSYKESHNCRREAEYASVVGVETLYVMMDENYTTAATCAKKPDGWLGVQIGKSLWFPLWKDEQIDTTAKNLLNKVSKPSPNPQHGSSGGGGGGGSPSPSTPLRDNLIASSFLSTSTISSPPWGQTTPQQIWMHKVLREARSEEAAFETLLSNLGIKEAEDTAFLSTDEIISIAKQLKPVQKRAYIFSQCYEILNDDQNLHDAAAARADLSSLGVSSPSDLSCFRKEDVTRLATRLKQAKRRIFEDLMEFGCNTGTKMEGAGAGGGAGEEGDIVPPMPIPQVDPKR